MKILSNIIKVGLLLFIIYLCLYSYFVYKDVIFSIGFKDELKGKIVYGSKGWYIKVIDLPSGKNNIVYTCPLSYREHVRYAHYPSFSPDGKMIVFSQSEYLFDDKLYIMNSDGSNARLFLDLRETGALFPSWSPDSKKIAFVVQQRDQQGLYTIQISDRSITCVSKTSLGESQPAWSPDSKEVAFTSKYPQRKELGNGYYEETILGGTYIINIDTKEIKKYIDLALQPAWSPDGKSLAYGDKYGYHVISLGGPSYLNNEYLFIPHKKILFGRGGAFPIRWSPDGKYLVFCKDIWPGLAGIYVVAIDNPKKHIRIATDHESIIGMSWGK